MDMEESWKLRKTIQMENDEPTHGPSPFHRNSILQTFFLNFHFSTIHTSPHTTYNPQPARMAAPTALLPTADNLVQEDTVLTAPGMLPYLLPIPPLSTPLSNSKTVEEDDGGILLDPT